MEEKHHFDKGGKLIEIELNSDPTKKIKLRKRWKSKSPKLFKRITNFCVALGAIGTAIALSPVALPAAIVGYSGYLIAVGIAGGTISKLTVEK